ncbi:hypothetical protein HS088_TW23G00397 [Tripterygium wilfordii]|uniref:Cytochrome P450 89A2-like n=1 Tax=Tripterygium wilfordii TaxID=458696 RepID=A0A7J7BUV0_TRIWF|nr:hypothetical protein HS088_TW23G00397 [Tripterygium wilfordii]
MDIWFMLLISISIAALLKPLINLLIPTNKLPPGPRRIPIISDLLWLRRTPADSEPILRSLHANLGPIITLRIWSRTSIFVADRYLAHKALVQNGAVFADRPPCLTTRKILTCNQGNINSASYGPNWRLFRRNLTSEILNPSRVRAYSHARKWVLQILIDRLVSDSKSVIEDVMLDKYLIPKNGTVNFMLAEMGWDPKVWEDPMGFKPERFIGSDGEVVFDITGSKEIKMMPFGVVASSMDEGGEDQA